MLNIPGKVGHGMTFRILGVSMRGVPRTLVLLACMLWLPGWVRAQGSNLHGIGAVNSSMGGAGTALTIESLGALTFNPALIIGVTGNQVSFSTEFFQDRPRIDLTQGSLTGRTNPTLQLGVIPAFGWMMRAPNGKLAIGFGLIGVAGFRTDYPQDNASILFSQPPGGYGRIFTDYSLTKIPLAVAYQATKKLAIGLSFNLYRGTLAIAPLPAATFDTDAVGNKFFPQGGNQVAHFAVGGQVGLLYQATDKISIGASYTSPQEFKDWVWNSTIADPASPHYGLARKLAFNLDGPGNVGFGVGFKPNPKTKIAVDGMYTKYSTVGGFGGQGGIDLVLHTVRPFGWRDIWTFKTGMQYQVTPKIDVRAGFNYSQTPIHKEIVLARTGTPATFQKHYCIGMGMALLPSVTAEAGFYYVPREHVIGPNLGYNGVIPNSTYDMSNQLTSVQIAFNFHF
jgi:long-chain fatty acid transport protein